MRGFNLVLGACLAVILSLSVWRSMFPKSALSQWLGPDSKSEGCK